MNINYLLSILDLYLLKQKEQILIIQVDNQTNQVKINFSYSNDYFNKTFVKISKEEFFTNIELIQTKIKANYNLKEEKYFNNNYLLDYEMRKINFFNFSLEELKKIHQAFFQNDDFTFELENNQTYENIQKQQTPKLGFSMGFASYLTLLISSVFFLDIFMIALLVFSFK